MFIAKTSAIIYLSILKVTSINGFIAKRPGMRSQILSLRSKHGETKESSVMQSGLSDVENIYFISDLHTDNVANFRWLKERCTSQTLDGTPGRNDCLIIAGDISHELSKLEDTLSTLSDNLQCHLFFIWGNHEGMFKFSLAFYVITVHIWKLLISGTLLFL